MINIVTLGICVRNGEYLLRDALKSISAQDFPHENIQLIIVDDGSEDNTPQIIDDYIYKTDIRTNVFRINQSGLGIARNKVIDNADGEIIVWVDSDEIITSSYVRKQVDFMEKNPDVGITAGCIDLVPNKLVLNLELMPGLFSHSTFENEASFIWKTRRLVGTGGSAFRVKALRQVNGFNNKLKDAGEDVDVAERIVRVGWKIRLNDAKFYELHGGLSNFNDLWKKYCWYGYGAAKIYSKNRNVFSFPRMTPVAGIITGLFYSLMGYRLTAKKIVFLLPIHYGIKMTAWSFGFMKCQFETNKRKIKSSYVSPQS
jgi:glycosyltransferase involved in cell wall biosynthesis